MDVKTFRIVRIGLTEAEAFKLGSWLEENSVKGDDEVVDEIYDHLDKLGYILENLGEKEND